jgi:hypothetical protein
MRFWKIGEYGWNWENRSPDPIYFDRDKKQIFMFLSKKIKIITDDEIKNNNKNIDNRNAYYKIYHKSLFTPTCIANIYKTYYRIYPK